MKKRTTILIIILVVLFGVASYLIYTNFLVAEIPSPAVSIIPSLKIKTEFPLEILEDPKFTALLKHGELPVKVSQKGKINPFMKF